MNIPLEEKVNGFLKERGSTAQVIKGYGMTEVCATATCELHNAIKEGSVGIPFIHNNIMIYDNTNEEELQYGQIGEISLQCASMMIGYKDNPSEMDALIKTHPDGSRWIHTGDLGYVDEDGFLFVEGRMKRMIMTIKEGLVYKIFPSQTEEVINNHQKIRESCVVSMHKGKDIVLKAVVRLNSAITETEKEKLIQELEHLCSNALSVNQIPYKYDFVDDFPRTAAGKVDYVALEKMAADEELFTT